MEAGMIDFIQEACMYVIMKIAVIIMGDQT
jgi:hypothetical protein